MDTRPANDGHDQPTPLPPFDRMRRQRNCRGGFGWEALPPQRTRRMQLLLPRVDGIAIVLPILRCPTPGRARGHNNGTRGAPGASPRMRRIGGNNASTKKIGMPPRVFSPSLESPFPLALIPSSLRYSVDALAVAFPHPRTSGRPRGSFGRASFFKCECFARHVADCRVYSPAKTDSKVHKKSKGR